MKGTIDQRVGTLDTQSLTMSTMISNRCTVGGLRSVVGTSAAILLACSRDTIRIKHIVVEKYENWLKRGTRTESEPQTPPGQYNNYENKEVSGFKCSLDASEARLRQAELGQLYQFAIYKPKLYISEHYTRHRTYYHAKRVLMREQLRKVLEKLGGDEINRIDLAYVQNMDLSKKWVFEHCDPNNTQVLDQVNVSLVHADPSTPFTLGLSVIRHEANEESHLRSSLLSIANCDGGLRAKEQKQVKPLKSLLPITGSSTKSHFNKYSAHNMLLRPGLMKKEGKSSTKSPIKISIGFKSPIRTLPARQIKPSEILREKYMKVKSQRPKTINNISCGMAVKPKIDAKVIEFRCEDPKDQSKPLSSRQGVMTRDHLIPRGFKVLGAKNAETGLNSNTAAPLKTIDTSRRALDGAWRLSSKSSSSTRYLTGTSRATQKPPRNKEYRPLPSESNAEPPKQDRRPFTKMSIFEFIGIKTDRGSSNNKRILNS